MNDEYVQLDAVEQAQLVTTSAVHGRELVEAAIHRAEEVNPSLNAIIIPLFERALREVDQQRPLKDSDRPPFQGVPLAVKDLLLCQGGTPSYMGNRALLEAKWKCPGETAFARRLARAGFITVGKTNTPEFGIQPTTQPFAFGPTRNPWALDLSPGGSSGGSAAVVASGIVPIAHGNDAGGSIRLPASCCGVVGLKPSRGRNTLGSALTSQIAENVLCRSVRDAAGVLDAVHGTDPGEPYSLGPPRLPFLASIDVDPPKLRIGLMTSVGEIETAPECTDAAHATAHALASLGHIVEPVALPLGDIGTGHDKTLIDCSNTSYRVAQLARMLGRDVQPADVEPYTWAAHEVGRHVSALQLFEAQDAQHQRALNLVNAWHDAEIDVLLTSVMARPPSRLDELVPPTDAPLRMRERFAEIWLFTAPFNITGQPAISLPFHWRVEDGVPIGVQLVAGLGREDLLLGLGAQLERMSPWSRRYPAHAPAERAAQAL